MPRKSAPAALPVRYEQALEELEGLLQQLESGQMPLDQMLASYQRGAALLAFCRQRLQTLENQVRTIDGDALNPLPDA